MKRLGIDVGGTNTDAVLVADNKVLASVKTFTTADIIGGITEVLAQLVALTGDEIRGVSAVMIGTTHYTNAVVERRNINRAAAIRICLPASASLPPFCDWPAELAAIANGGTYLVRGGHEYDGREIESIDELAIADAARKIRTSGVNAVAISAVFSPLTDVCEVRAAQIVRQEHPDAHITLSSKLGRIGLLERENVALLNACLIDLSRRITRAFGDALAASGLNARLYLTRNDGTLSNAQVARDYPVFSFASGPTNSMRGAALLSGVSDALVCDVGGTTSDIGQLINGFPREANNVVEIGGVRTLFRMPDLLSVALGGGTIISEPDALPGQRSVAHQLAHKARVFGGDILTCTDIAVAAGLADIGDRSRLRGLSSTVVNTALRHIHHNIADAVDKMKTSSAELPLLAVGGGAMLIPETMPGVSRVVHTEQAAVANAVGAAIAQISGESDRIYREVSRDDAIAMARQSAIDEALSAGARADTLKVVDIEDLPLSYLPGQALRVSVRVVGDAAL